ncbi:hypothetical protein HPB50_018539 [Hyalomma asiaticum]|uniref:Uncharacterized protein n=1 Tax=Hyalomma asiaticum TaxID=266040 RepID=A0ACB7TML6_HYAAI|nr:hypothetical protein HPB50_018539 [Hyalomma asiaticum]
MKSGSHTKTPLEDQGSLPTWLTLSACSRVCREAVRHVPVRLQTMLSRSHAHSSTGSASSPSREEAVSSAKKGVTELSLLARPDSSAGKRGSGRVCVTPALEAQDDTLPRRKSGPTHSLEARRAKRASSSPRSFSAAHRVE